MCVFWFAGCYKITTVFSHAQTVVLCVGCSTVLCQPTGGKARLTEGTQCLHVEETFLSIFWCYSRKRNSSLTYYMLIMSIVMILLEVRMR